MTAFPVERKGPIERIKELGIKTNRRVNEIAEIVLQERSLRIRRKTDNRESKIRRRRRKRALGGLTELVIRPGTGHEEKNERKEGWKKLRLPPGIGNS